MIRTLIQAFLLLIVLLAVRSVVRSIFVTPKKPADGVPTPQGPPAMSTNGGELRKDPICGSYVSAATSLNLTASGQTFYFCSQECLDKFRA